MDRHDDLMVALDAAFAGHWSRTRELLAPLPSDEIGDWLAALCCKSLGMEAEARARYAAAGRDYDLFPQPRVELRAIHHELVHERRE